MNSIIVKVNDLWATLNLMKKEGMSQVELFLHEGDDECPPCISLNATSKKECGIWVDYEEVSAVPVDEVLG